MARSMGEEWAKTTFQDHIAYLRRREDERAILAFFAWKRKVLHVAFDSCVGGTHSWHVELTFGILGLEDVISKRAARACRPFSELQSAMQGTDEDTSALNVDLFAVGGGQLCKSSLSLKDLLIQNGLPRDVPLQEEVGNETVALGQFLPLKDPIQDEVASLAFYPIRDALADTDDLAEAIQDSLAECAESHGTSRLHQVLSKRSAEEPHCRSHTCSQSRSFQQLNVEILDVQHGDPADALSLEAWRSATFAEPHVVDGRPRSCPKNNGARTQRPQELKQPGMETLELPMNNGEETQELQKFSKQPGLGTQEPHPQNACLCDASLAGPRALLQMGRTLAGAILSGTSMPCLAQVEAPGQAPSLRSSFRHKCLSLPWDATCQAWPSSVPISDSLLTPLASLPGPVAAPSCHRPRWLHQSTSCLSGLWHVLLPQCSRLHDPFRATRVGEASHPGPVNFPSVGDPSFCDLQIGDFFDVVLQWGPQECIALWHQQRCNVRNPTFHCPGIYTVYNACLVSPVDGLPTISIESDSIVIPKPPVDSRSCHRMVELCAGLGGISVGMQASGGVTLAAVDCSLLACQTLCLNQTLAIHGNLHDRDTRLQLHRSCCATSNIVAAGIPCQGYSSQGAQRGYDDTRSKTLLPVLQVLWHTQGLALILECVTAIENSQGAMAALRDFSHRAGFVLSTTRLELAHQWPARRSRWWGVLTPAYMAPLQLHWPQQPDQCIAAVIPAWPTWPSADLQQLQWSESEAQAYADPTFGSDCRILHPDSVMPTLLHSYGSPLSGCPCGCRDSGFSAMSLVTKGLRGFGVKCEGLVNPRYLHPEEAGLLCTLPVLRQHVPNLKAALCLIGQIAAPLQSLWVISQVQRWFTNQLGGCPVSPPDLLHSFKKELLFQRSFAWKVPAMMAGGLVTLRHELPDGGKVVVRCSGPTTVQNVLDAEAPFRPAGYKLVILREGHILPPSAFLHFHGEYVVTLRRKRKAVDHHAGSFCVRLGQHNALLGPRSSHWGSLQSWAPYGSFCHRCTSRQRCHVQLASCNSGRCQCRRPKSHLRTATKYCIADQGGPST